MRGEGACLAGGGREALRRRGSPRVSEGGLSCPCACSVLRARARSGRSARGRQCGLVRVRLGSWVLAPRQPRTAWKLKVDGQRVAAARGVGAAGPTAPAGIGGRATVPGARARVPLPRARPHPPHSRSRRAPGSARGSVFSATSSGAVARGPGGDWPRPGAGSEAASTPERPEAPALRAAGVPRPAFPRVPPRPRRLRAAEPPGTGSQGACESPSPGWTAGVGQRGPEARGPRTPEGSSAHPPVGGRRGFGDQEEQGPGVMCGGSAVSAARALRLRVPLARTLSPVAVPCGTCSLWSADFPGDVQAGSAVTDIRRVCINNDRSFVWPKPEASPEK